METTKLRRFAQYARTTLLKLVDARLQLVLMSESMARRENPLAVRELETQIRENSQNAVVDRVAYTWFNRFCALRYMDVNRVNRINVVSAVNGQFQPEILAEAKMGHIDEDMVPVTIQAKVRALLDGTAPSPDPQQEAYRLLVVAACNYWQQAMPFLFEAIADYTELLMPDDLLSGNSILAYTREAMTPDACQDVEVIGWLYQFYISEKKDEVFEGLKKNKKITPENIPAATQLFTPHWIVRYLVENSLGRLWLLNRPNSKLAGKMDYYIAPQTPVTDFLCIAKPEDIKLCDPACGSGHMLTYAFDLLYAIYEEEGADPAEIPEKILTHNLYGIEIDERAAELAAFALAMKARGKQRRFLNKSIQPNICVLRPIKIAPQDLDAYVAEVGRDLFTANLRTLLTQFEEADNFGSLIRPVAMDYAEIRRVLAEKGVGNQLLLEHVHRDVQHVLEQAEYLSQRYQVVVANPPYMSRSNMNKLLKAWLETTYPEGKYDLYAAFILRALEMQIEGGLSAMVTIQNWMFLSSFEELRDRILKSRFFANLVQIGYNSFPELNSKVVQATAFVLVAGADGQNGEFVNLNDAPQSADKHEVFTHKLRNKDWFIANTNTFKRLPGEPIAYWVSDRIAALFQYPAAGEIVDLREGIHTGDNEQFLRLWHEVEKSDFALGCCSDEDVDHKGKWVPYNKGGAYRKWFGNNQLVIAWDKKSRDAMSALSGHVRPSKSLYFKEGGTWSALTSGYFGIRYYPSGHLFDSKGQVAVGEKAIQIIGQFNTKVFQGLAKTIMPTLDYKCGDVKKLPFLQEAEKLADTARVAIQISKSDWNAFETSWDFSILPLLADDYRSGNLEFTYARLRSQWRSLVQDTKQVEEKNNRTLIEAYALQDELTPDVPLSEITLTCNPHYRYGGDKSEQELEDLLRADTMREFMSYAVGCMFGRYSLDKPGLILANQAETLEDYLRQVPKPRFTPDADNVIPLLDGDWFPDDITGRFREFLRVTFGDEHFDENLRFVEIALGKKGKPIPIRDFFLKEFYADHVKRYKKRPIYWLFSSGSGTKAGSFNALIYLHRYRPDTASIVLQYLRDFRSKLLSERNHQEQLSINGSASPGEKTKALKRIEELKKILSELDDYERETLYPLATHQVALDLDDGVKVNYVKLGAALKKIPGLDAKDEE